MTVIQSGNPLSYLGVKAPFPPNIISLTSAPTTTTIANLGDIAIVAGASSYQLVSVSGATYTWALLGGGSADVNTINNLSPTAGNITIAGTANQVSVANAGSTVTLSLPSAITAPGSLTTTTGLTAGSGFTVSAGAVAVTSGTSAINISADAAATTVNIATGAAVKGLTLGSTNTTSATTVQAGSGGITLTGAVSASAAVTAATSITATAGDITATLGNVIINGAAKQLRCHGGAVTDFIGQATLTNGTVTIANTNIATTDRIFLQRSAVNASSALGVFKSVITGSTNFVITACKPADGTTETGDVSTVDYFIVRQV